MHVSRKAHQRARGVHRPGVLGHPHFRNLGLAIKVEPVRAGGPQSRDTGRKIPASGAASMAARNGEASDELRGACPPNA
jgi:hypothetical protein